MLRVIARVLYILFVILETLLGIRFLFKLVYLPASIPIANWVYTQTDKILFLFSGTGLYNFEVLGFLIETKTLLAIAVVTVINWALAEIIKIYSK